MSSDTRRALNFDGSPESDSISYVQSSGSVTRKSSSFKNINDRRFDQMLEKLLLVRLFVTFEVTQLTCHNMTCCNPEIRI